MTTSSTKPYRSHLWYHVEQSQSKWTLMWGAINGHALRLYATPSDEPDSPPVHLIDLRLYSVEEMRNTAPCTGKMWGKCLEVSLKVGAEALPELLGASPPRFFLAAETAVAHCSWTRALTTLSTDIFIVDGDSSDSPERIGTCMADNRDEESLRWTLVDLLPETQVLAFLCSRQMSVLLAVQKARTLFQEGAGAAASSWPGIFCTGNDDVHRLVSLAINLLQDLHTAVVRTDMDLADDTQEEPHAFERLETPYGPYGRGSRAASKAWLSRVQVYVVRLMQELERLKKRIDSEAEAEARCLDLISDACKKLEAVDAICQEELEIYRTDSPSSPEYSPRYAVGGKRLVPSSRQRYSRFWASKISL